MADLGVQEKTKKTKCCVPIQEKFNLTIEEATQYFNIGRDKLYELVNEEGCKFVLHNGRNILIKRTLFEKHLEQISYI